MNRRAGILLVALLIVVGGVLWLALGLKREPLDSADSVRARADVQQPSTPHTELERATGAEKRALEPTAKTVERTRVEPRTEIGDEARVDPELRAAAWVEGRVELAPGTPSDEDVYVVAKGRTFEHRPLYRAKVEHDGRFRVAFAQGTQVGWLVIAARYNFLGDEFALRPAKPPQDIVLKGTLGGCVRGRISLAPTALAFVDDVKQGEISIGEHEFDFFAIGRQPGVIASDLTYEVGGIEPASGLNLLLKARGLVPLRHADVTIEAGRSMIIDLAPEMGIRLAGRVVNAAGNGIAEARVSPKRATEQRDFLSMPQFTLTGADGSFELVGLEEGAVSILTQKQGFEPLVSDLGTFQRGAEKRGLELKLSEGLALTGRVEFPGGKLAARALVSAIDENADDDTPEIMRMFDANALMQREPFETASDGTFRLTGLTPGTYTVTAEAWVDAANDKSIAIEDDTERARKVRRKGTPWSGRLERVTAPASDLVVALKNGESIRGRIVDSQGKTVERFVVNASPDSDSPGYTSEIKEIEKAYRDKDGRFVLEGLRACNWRITVRAKGHLDSEPLKITVPGSNQDLRFTLLRQAKLTGVVFDPDNKPLARAKVVCAADSAQWWTGGASTHSNDKGEFTVTQVPLGAIRVHAEANGFARGEPVRFELGPGAVKKDLQLFVAKGGTIKGVVKKSDGSPHANCQVEANEIDGRWDKNVKTDAEGAFIYEGLGPGRYELVTSEPRGKRARLLEDVDDDADEPEYSSATVAVRAGETVSVTLGGKRALSIRMHGRITVPGGRAQKIVVTPLASESKKSIQAEVGENGRYELLLTQSGAHSVMIERNGSGFSARSIVHVPLAAEFAQDFEFPTCSLSGRVVTPADEPVANYRVRASFPGARDTMVDTNGRETETDDTGAFKIDNLPEGVVTVEAIGAREWWEESKTEGRARIEGVKLAADKPVVDLVLVLKSAGEVSGHVRSAAGEPLPYVEVIAFDEHGHSLQNQNGQAISNTAGRFTINGVPKGRVLLYARTIHSAGKASVVALDDAPVEVDIALRPRADLTVLVQDAAGGPMFAPLEILDAEGRHFEEIPPLDRYLEAPAGARAFPSLPAGKYVIRALVPGGGTMEKTALLTEGGRADVVLR